MSLILHLETAGTVCSVALSQNGKLLALKEENKGYTHAEHLTLFIEEVMQMTGKNYSELSAVAVSKGPGSYTGLRIGVASAKGICYGLNIPLIALNTLASLANGAFNKHGKDVYYCPMVDARRMEVYTAVYYQGKIIIETEAKILNENSFLELLLQKEVLFFGDGALKFKDICKHTHATFDLTIQPSASYMIDLTYKKFLNNEFEDLAYFEPYYLKEFYSPNIKPKI
jgi:tRNA threonylcarbamoyladenosine biosynthesis protein TsaB